MDGHRSKLSPQRYRTQGALPSEQASPLPTYVGHGAAVSGELLTAAGLHTNAMLILSTFTAFTAGLLVGFLTALIARKFMEPEGHLG